MKLVSGGHARPAGASMRLLEHNILEGGGSDDRFRRWCAWIAGQDADVVCLCECNGWLDGRLDEARRMTELAYGLVLRDGPSSYPPGVLARRPIERIAELRAGFAHGALHVRVESLDILVAHLSPADEQSRITEAGELLNHLQGIDAPALLVGDLNSHSISDADHYRRMELPSEMMDFRVHEQFVSHELIDLGADAESLGYTTATGLNPDEPKRRLDYIYANTHFVSRYGRPAVRVIHEAAATDLSDHWPIVLQWNGRRGSPPPVTQE
ncbi:MAG: endonuclease/exonuclease/phosphatase family protein [Phycisphaerae bacterium]